MFRPRSPTGLPGDDVSGPSGASSGPSVPNETNIDGADKKGRTSGASLGRSSGRVRGVAGVSATTRLRRRRWSSLPACGGISTAARTPDCPSGGRRVPTGSSRWETSPSPSCSRPRPRSSSRCAGSTIGDAGSRRTVGLPWRGPSIGRWCGATRVGARRGKKPARFPSGSPSPPTGT